LKKIEFLNPLILRGFENIKVQTIILKENENYIFKLLNKKRDENWEVNSSGIIEIIENNNFSNEEINIEEIKNKIKNSLKKEEIYKFLETFELILKEKFQWLELIYSTDDVIFSQIRYPSSDESIGYIIVTYFFFYKFYFLFKNFFSTQVLILKNLFFFKIIF
jgi:hypothetical protein